MQEIPDLIACEECDAIHSRPAPGGNEVAMCSRCGAELERDMSAYGRRVLPLAIASFFIYIIANTFPIVEMELQGIVSRTTLIGAVLSLNTAGMPFVASLVLATTILFPLIQLLVLIYLLVSVTRSGYHPAFNLLVRLIQTLQPWVMVEVFLLGTIVALVKLTNMATVLPGAALWAFGALTILLAAVSSFNPRYIWKMALSKKAERSHVS
ncbi:paraquat-inducible protein A [Nitrosovibrio sp. Nv6]|uniref:paraquat-inducible protein A n=1 Tax=Nitrosovibrio sp. Nv6 TaxID=1855340 RepID=UPI0008B6B579|nr:paraquat-inducible protein A [Nitrosovibrio sp. Nv6]SEO69675.1 paraquat-inducible protein A [Nitrosovibrio sp. Nv6]